MWIFYSAVNRDCQCKHVGRGPQLRRDVTEGARGQRNMRRRRQGHGIKNGNEKMKTEVKEG